MYLYPTISYFPSSGNSSQGTPITLAEFMAKGKDYRVQIAVYRITKQRASTLRAQLQSHLDTLHRLSETIALGINPLDPNSEQEYNLAIQQQADTQATIDQLNEAIKQADTEASRIKRSLPAATLSGYFYPKRKEADLQQHSGFICIDIDDHFNRKNSAGQNVSFPQSLDHVMDVLQQLPWVLYAAHSVGGVGYFAIIPIGPVSVTTPKTSTPAAGAAAPTVPTPAEGVPTLTEATPAEGVPTPTEARPTEVNTHTHKWYFECLEEEFREYGLIIDPACSDVTRLRIISYDEHPYRNAHAIPYMGRYGFIGREEKKRREDEARRAAEASAYRARLNKSDSDVLRDVEACVQQIEQRALDITQDYLTTVKIGMSLYSLGDSGLYLWKRICRFRSADHTHLRTDRDLEQRWRTFGTGKSVPVEWFFKYLIDTSSPEYGHPAWTVFAHPRRQ